MPTSANKASIKVQSAAHRLMSHLGKMDTAHGRFGVKIAYYTQNTFVLASTSHSCAVLRCDWLFRSLNWNGTSSLFDIAVDPPLLLRSSSSRDSQEMLCSRCQVPAESIVEMVYRHPNIPHGPKCKWEFARCLRCAVQR